MVPNEDGEVPVVFKGERTFVKPSEVDFAIVGAKHMFSDVTNLVPLLHQVQGNRAYMAANQSEQAVSLKEPETPLLYTGETMGDSFLIKAKENGTITEVTDSLIKIDDEKYEIPEPSKLGLGSTIIYKAVVKKGDSVKKGDVLAETNFHKKGEIAYGRNLNVAYMPYKGMNIEDGVVITEQAAEKLTSLHTYNYELSVDDTMELNKHKFKALFPMEISMENINKIGDNGLIKNGVEVMPGDILIAATRKKEATEEDKALSRFGKALGSQMRDAGVRYEGDHKGTVISSVNKNGEVRVVIQTEKKAVVGDKITGRAGNKGIIAAIIPNDEAPKDKQGNLIEIMMNPIGVPSRINPSQLTEIAITKKDDGKRRKVESFKDFISEEAKESGSKETIIDPELGEIENVPVGKQYILKLVHVVDKKITGRAVGGYTADKTPSKGGGSGGQSVGQGALYALLGHGAEHLIEEMVTSKSEDNPDLWKAIVNGETLPIPKETFVFKKGLSIMNAMGIDTERVGSTINFFPMDDKKTDKIKTEIQNAGMLQGAKYTPEKGGLFDFNLGGEKGGKWGKVTLNSPVINPLFKKNISIILSESEDEINKYGKEELYNRLKKIDVDNEIEIIKERKKTSKMPVSLRDKLNKKLKLLYGLKKAGTGPESYMMRTIPVVPPTIRPISINKQKGMVMAHDFNQLYRDLIQVNNNAKEKEKTTKRDEKRIQEKVDELFNGKTNDAGKEFKGLVSYLSGTNPKTGFFQSKMVKKRQDYSGRTTLTPGPNLGPGEIGLPAKLGLSLYKPFIIKSLKDTGYKMDEIKTMIDNESKEALGALKEVSENRPVIFNRAPSLHKYSIMAAKPKIHLGKDLKVNPLYLAGFNADFDGDSSINSILYRISKLDIGSEIWYTPNMEVVNMPFKGNEKIRYSYGVVNLEDFPRGKMIEKKGNKTIYEVPEGVEVLTVWNGKEKWIKPESFHIHKDLDMLNIKTSSSRTVQCSDDHSLVTVDEELGYKRDKASIGMTIPRLRTPVDKAEFNLIEELEIDKQEESKYIFSTDKFKLNHDFGYFLGVYVGDGWVSSSEGRSSHYICLAADNSYIPDKIKEIISGYFTEDIHIGKVPNPHTFEGKESYCEKHTWFSKTFWNFLETHISKGAENKHLPLFWMQTTEQFRWGLLAGLIDTDGSVSITNSKDKKTKGNHISYNTNSKRLAYEIVALAHTLDLTATTVPTQTPKGKKHWVVSFNHESLNKMQRKLLLQLPKKKEKLAKLNLTKSSFEQKKYTPKLSDERMDELRKAIGSPRIKNKKGEVYSHLTEEDIKRIKARKSLNVIVTRIKKNDTAITLETAKKIFDLDLDLFKTSFWNKWKTMCLDPKIDWEMITEIEPIPFITEAYDLTIPPAYTMVTESGIIIYDTMSVHIPITPEAVKDTDKMLVNKNIFNDAYGQRIMPELQGEQISGIYSATAKGPDMSKKVQSFGSVEEFLKRFEVAKNTMKPDTPVKIPRENKGEVTTAGRVVINSCFPRFYREYKGAIKKSELKMILNKFIPQLEPEDVADRMNTLKNYSNFFATKYPISVGVEDFYLDTKKKDKLLDRKNLKNHNQLVNKTFDVNDKIKEELRGKNNFLILSEVGAKGNELQTQQILGMPGFTMGLDGKPSKHFIKSNFSEGLNADEFWNTIPGARAGMLARSESTAMPGYLAKMLTNSATDQVITIDDCGTSKGRDYSPENKEIIHRLLAVGVGKFKKDTIITTEVFEELKQEAKKLNIKKVKVRSPQTCEAEEGICSKCWGADNYDKLKSKGFQIGIVAAQAISEPLTQGAMNSFHTGGLATRAALKRDMNTGIPEGFARIQQTFGLSENRKGKGVICEKDGTVKEIKTNSLGEVTITVDEKKYKVPKLRKVKVEIGEKVFAGNLMTDGLKDMQKIFEIKGDNINEFRDILTEDIKENLQFGVSDRTYEVITRSLTNLAKIEDDGGNPDIVAGDFTTLSKANSINNKGYNILQVSPLAEGEELFENIDKVDFKKGRVLSKLDLDKLKLYNIGKVKVKANKIKFSPQLKGVATLVHKKFDDPFQRMNYNRIGQSIQETTSIGGSTSSDSLSAVPRLVQGQNLTKDRSNGNLSSYKTFDEFSQI